MTEPDFDEQYSELDERFRLRAENDGDVYVPNLVPEGPVDYLLVSSEPSLKWAGSRQEAERRIRGGFRNFLYSVEDFIVHYAASEYMCKGGRTYHITDVSKGAMWVKDARRDQTERWNRWYGLLREEVSLVGPNAKIIPVGQKVDGFLTSMGIRNVEPPILHWSTEAARFRSEFIQKRRLEREFRRFAPQVELSDVVQVAERVMENAGMSQVLRNETLARIGRGSGLTEPRKKLLFVYKHQMT